VSRRKKRLPVVPNETDRNALGPFAEAAWIAQGDAPEDPEQLRELHEALRKDLRPRGFVEETLVETVAVCLWRKRRAILAEAGATTRQQTGVYRQKIEGMLRAADFSIMPPELQSAKDYQCNSLALDEPLERLKHLEVELAMDGRLSEETIKRMLRFWRDAQPGARSLGEWLFILNLALAPPETDAYHPMTPEQARKGIDEMIKAERERLEALKELLKEEEAMEQRAELMARSVPDPDTMRGLAQYIRAIDQEMYSALERLEQLQRARMGEALYALVRFASTASESQIRALKKLTCTRVRVHGGNGVTGMLEALKVEVR
jgi:hypothetical protein